MPRFVNREAELANLNRLLDRPGGQFIIVYGRRRVGKTTLSKPIAVCLRICRMHGITI